MSGAKVSPVKVTRAAFLSVVLSTAAFAQDQDAWIGPARLWISEVPERLLDECLKRTGGSGIVEVRVNAQGMVGLEALLGGEPVKRCVALVAQRLSAASIMGGYSTRLYFDPPAADAGRRIAEMPRDTLEGMGWIRAAGTAFAACESPQDCGAGQTCDHSATDGGMCIDLIDLWRSRRSHDFGPHAAQAVHLLPRTAAHCAGVGTKSDRVIIRVVDTSLRPIVFKLTVVPFRWANDGGVTIREALPTEPIGKGVGLSVDRPVLIGGQSEGCTSEAVVITPEVRACVLLVVDCADGPINP